MNWNDGKYYFFLLHKFSSLKKLRKTEMELKNTSQHFSLYTKKSLCRRRLKLKTKANVKVSADRGRNRPTQFMKEPRDHRRICIRLPSWPRLNGPTMTPWSPDEMSVCLIWSKLSFNLLIPRRMLAPSCERKTWQTRVRINDADDVGLIRLGNNLVLYQKPTLTLF